VHTNRYQFKRVETTKTN